MRFLINIIIFLTLTKLLSARVLNEHEVREDYLSGHESSDVKDSVQLPLKEEPAPPRRFLYISEDCPTAILKSDNHFVIPDQICEFYECAAREAEKQKVCSKDDSTSYFLNYGEKYCKRFSEDSDEHLSYKGKFWLKNTLACLQKSLKEGCNKEKKCTDCKSIRKLAFDTHPYCYINSGLCFLNLDDQITIGKSVDTLDLLKGESLIQIKQVLSGCLGAYNKGPIDKVSDFIYANDPVYKMISGDFYNTRKSYYKTFREMKEDANYVHRSRRSFEIKNRLGLDPSVKLRYFPIDNSQTKRGTGELKLLDGEIIEIIPLKDGSIDVY